MSEIEENKNNKNENYRLGILFIMCSACCFAFMSLFIRLSGDLPVMQKCFYRNAVAMVIAICAIVKSKCSFKPGKGNVKYLFFRAAGGTLGMVCNFYAIDHLPISDAAILNKLSPFFAILFSILFLGEIANKLDVGAVLIAFCGALFVVKPSFNVEVIPAVIGALGGCFAGFAYTFMRKLGKRGENSMVIVLFFSVFSCVVTFPLMLFDYVSPSPLQTFYLWMTGAAAAGGQIFITKAYSYAPAKEISVYDFTNVIFAAILGMIFLSQRPDYLSVIGYVIIIGISVIKWKITKARENKI